MAGFGTSDNNVCSNFLSTGRTIFERAQALYDRATDLERDHLIVELAWSYNENPPNVVDRLLNDAKYYVAQGLYFASIMFSKTAGAYIETSSVCYDVALYHVKSCGDIVDRSSAAVRRGNARVARAER